MDTKKSLKIRDNALLKTSKEVEKIKALRDKGVALLDTIDKEKANEFRKIFAAEENSLDGELIREVKVTSIAIDESGKNIIKAEDKLKELHNNVSST